MPLPTDPQLGSQWHLINTAPGGLDLNLQSIWNPANGPAYTGSGIRIAQADFAFQYGHPDLVANYSTTTDFDFLNNDADPSPSGGGLSGANGTALLGLIGANDNAANGVGVAFDALVFGYGLSSLPAAGQMATWFDHLDQALASAKVNADVLNLGNTLADVSTMQFSNQASLAQLAALRADVADAVSTGRGGLGLIITVGSGTQGTLTDRGDTNSYGQTTDTRQIIVGSVQQSGFAMAGSGEGASLLVSAFGQGLATLDITGADGFVAGDFNTGYSGGGAAGALVSGVVSLMLDANDQLGWRDVQTILAYGARHVGTDIGQGFNSAAGFNEGSAWFFNGASTWNGGGLHYSNVYGFGLVDAHASVRLAETWFLGLGTIAAQTTANETAVTTDMLGTAITLNGSSSSQTALVTQDLVVERVAVSVDFQTAFLSDVDLRLIGPDGTEIVLLADQAGSGDFDGTWVVETQALRGISSAGTWQVILEDDTNLDPTLFRDVQLTIFGSTQVNDRYVFTNEYSDYGAYNRVNVIADTNGGTDVANAAAVTGNMSIFLDGRLSLIDTMRTRFTGVENAIGGDGNDALTGSDGANMLWGGRGRDTLNGLAGADTLYGDSGNDNLQGNDGNDRIFGGDGNDTLYGSFAGIGTVTTDNDTLDGGAGNDFIYGRDGNDIILMGTGNDYVDGGAGFDAVSYNAETAGVLVDLSGTLAHVGGALGDTLVNVERVIGSNLDDTLHGNADGNGLTGGAGADRLFGGDGNDRLDGGSGSDTTLGRAGNDTHVIDSSGDRVFETTTTTGTTDAGGIDRVQSSISVNLDGYAGIRFVENLLLTGTAHLSGTGNALGNSMTGNSGNNNLNGGAGNDTLIGGAGADTFLFTTALGATNIDSLTDFDVAADTIRLENAIFTGLATGTLAASAFVANTSGKAADASDRIIYETDTGRLFFDMDGTGATAKIHFATLASGLALTNADFVAF